MSLWQSDCEPGQRPVHPGLLIQPVCAAEEGGGAQAGLKALYTCTSWYAYAAMFGSSA